MILYIPSRKGWRGRLGGEFFVILKDLLKK